MRMMRSILLVVVIFGSLTTIGCSKKPLLYGTERQLALPGRQRQIWAVAPTLNLSGMRHVDPLLQSDIVFAQLQQVAGLTVIPVNRVVEVYASLRIEKVQNEEQAAYICEQLGCDALLVPTVTAYDPYNPPKLGAALQLFTRPRSYVRAASLDVRELSRQPSPRDEDVTSGAPAKAGFTQVVGLFDAANGSVRDSLTSYAAGRNDPAGPLGVKEYLVNMDRYCGFVYYELIEGLLAARGHRT